MLSLFFTALQFSLFLPSESMNYTYTLENLAPDFSKNVTYTFNESYDNLDTCRNLCNTLNNCSGFYDDNSTCKGIHNVSNMVTSTNYSFYKKIYCNNNCYSNTFLVNVNNERCFCDDQCNRMNDCCNDYQEFCVTTTPTTTPTTSPTTTPTTSPTTTPTTSPTVSPTTSPTSTPTTTQTLTPTTNVTNSSNDNENYLYFYILVSVFVGIIFILLLYYCCCSDKNIRVNPQQQRDERVVVNNMYDSTTRTHTNPIYEE